MGYADIAGDDPLALEVAAEVRSPASFCLFLLQHSTRRIVRG
jgi:hypothetical protein